MQSPVFFSVNILGQINWAALALLGPDPAVSAPLFFFSFSLSHSLIIIPCEISPALNPPIIP
jgi:hypothetical protein